MTKIPVVCDPSVLRRLARLDPTAKLALDGITHRAWVIGAGWTYTRTMAPVTPDDDGGVVCGLTALHALQIATHYDRLAAEHVATAVVDQLTVRRGPLSRAAQDDAAYLALQNTRRLCAPVFDDAAATLGWAGMVVPAVLVTATHPVRVSVQRMTAPAYVFSHRDMRALADAVAAPGRPRLYPMLHATLTTADIGGTTFRVTGIAGEPVLHRVLPAHAAEAPSVLLDGPAWGAIATLVHERLLGGDAVEWTVADDGAVVIMDTQSGSVLRLDAPLPLLRDRLRDTRDASDAPARSAPARAVLPVERPREEALVSAAPPYTPPVSARSRRALQIVR